jgi:hypothetical protein
VLVLQGTQQAMAATQFGGLQLADVLGDLGDISTGFASVKITAYAPFFFCYRQIDCVLLYSIHFRL